MRLSIRRTYEKNKKRNILSFGLLLLLIAVFLFPYYVMVVGAFKSQMALQLIPPDLNPFINLTGKNADYVWRKTGNFSGGLQTALL